MVARETRHLSREDQVILRDMANRVDVEEMLRAIGSMVAHDHPDLNAGTAFRSEVFRLAVNLGDDPAWVGRRYRFTDGRLIEVLSDPLPDLLAACKALLADCPSERYANNTYCDCGDGHSHNCIHLAAEDAIAKAEGRESRP
jgi:hypothetical protein